VVEVVAAAENVALRLEELYVDIKADRKETYQRVNSLEQRVAKIEATPT
jgi:flagellar hook-associated protein FlgK